MSYKHNQPVGALFQKVRSVTAMALVIVGSYLSGSLLQADETVLIHVYQDQSVGIGFGFLAGDIHSLEIQMQATNASNNSWEIATSQVITTGSVIWNPTSNDTPAAVHTYETIGFDIADEDHTAIFRGTLHLGPGPGTEVPKFDLAVAQVDIKADGVDAIQETAAEAPPTSESGMFIGSQPQSITVKVKCLKPGETKLKATGGVTISETQTGTYSTSLNIPTGVGSHEVWVKATDGQLGDIEATFSPTNNTSYTAVDKLDVQGNASDSSYFAVYVGNAFFADGDTTAHNIDCMIQNNSNQSKTFEWSLEKIGGAPIFTISPSATVPSPRFVTVSNEGWTSTYVPVTIELSSGSPTGDATVELTAEDKTLSGGTKKDTGTVKVIKIEIRQGDIDGDPIVGKTTKEVVGVKIHLTADVSNLNGAKYKWTIPGNVVQGYKIAPDGKTGKIDPLEAGEKESKDIKFHWIDKSDSEVVELEVTVDGNPTTVKTTYEILRPTEISLTSKTTLLTPAIDERNGWMQFGSHAAVSTSGIVWTGKAKGPKHANGAGKIGFLQRGRISERRFYTNPTILVKKTSSNGEWVLDGDKSFSGMYSLPEAIPEDGEGSISAEDSPRNLLLPIDPTLIPNPITREDDFEQNLMYQSNKPGSIYVTLHTVHWDWSGVATKGAGGWVVDPSSYTANPSSFNNTALPTWSKRHVDIKKVTTVDSFYIIKTSLVNGKEGINYFDQLVSSAILNGTTFTGGKLPVTWSKLTGPLPPPLKLDKNTGVISGKPTIPGIYSFWVKAEDSSVPKLIDIKKYTIAVGFTITTTGNPPHGKKGVAYPNTTLTTTGGTGNVSWTVTSGTLPPGLKLSTNGVIGNDPDVPNAPTTADSYTFEVTATDSTTPTAKTSTKSFTIIIEN